MNKGLDILLVEDNSALAQNIIVFVEAHGHRVHYASDGEAGLREGLYRDFDVILLDLSLPRRDGLNVCLEIRRRAFRRVPILMLTARDTLDDKLKGFANGADDYLVKPFALTELLARIVALGSRKYFGQEHCQSIGTLTIDRQARRAQRCGKTLRLSPILWEILLVLADHSPHPVTRDSLTRSLWGEDPPSSDTLRSHMHLLRQIVDKPFDSSLIKTVHGVGFKLDATK